MKRAMDNLLSNALFYAKKKVLVRVKLLSRKGIFIDFEDDGPGVPKDKREDVVREKGCRKPDNKCRNPFNMFRRDETEYVL